MRHARPEDLVPLESLLQRIRDEVPGLKERKPGTFYRKSQGFLHFHVDPAGFFADVKAGGDWRRLQVDTPDQQRALLDVAVAAAAE